MKQPIVQIVFALSMVFALSTAQAATVEQVIKKARSDLGSERKLKAIDTITYHGTVLNAEGKEQGTMLLQFKRPDKQRLKLDQAETIDTTAVNGFEGWQERINKTNPLLNGVRVLPPEQVRFLTANAYENLNFFRGPDQVRGGKVELVGSSEVDGIACWEVLFSYPSGLSYQRFFDKSTGELVATIAGDNGFTMKENGKLEVNGIQFPKEVKTYQGDELIRSVVFEKIEINNDLPDSLFDFPMLPSAKPPQAE